MNPSALLSGKVCVVTGGSGGIGAAICRGFAASGGEVFIGYRNREAALAIRSDILSRGGSAEVVSLDVKSPASLERGAEEIYRKSGGIDAWVNCAGVIRASLLAAMREADWDEVIDTNLNGTMRGMRTAARYMIPQKGGSIINLSSISSRLPMAGQSNYAASKAGVEGLTRAAAVELGPKNVRVNAVAPGFVSTELAAGFLRERAGIIRKSIPLKRIADPAEIADVVTFLASDLSRHITGCVLTVDGGTTLGLEKWSSADGS